MDENIGRSKRGSREVVQVATQNGCTIGGSDYTCTRRIIFGTIDTRSVVSSDSRVEKDMDTSPDTPLPRLKHWHSFNTRSHDKTQGITCLLYRDSHELVVVDGVPSRYRR
jgi:hypothetical protein